MENGRMQKKDQFWDSLFDSAALFNSTTPCVCLPERMSHFVASLHGGQFFPLTGLGIVFQKAAGLRVVDTLVNFLGNHHFFVFRGRQGVAMAVVFNDFPKAFRAGMTDA